MRSLISSTRDGSLNLTAIIFGYGVLLLKSDAVAAAQLQVAAGTILWLKE